MKNLLLTSLLFTTAVAKAQISGDTVGVPAKTALQEVTVSASGRRLKDHVESTQMGRIDLPVSMLLKAPAIGGEADIIKALQLTPGIKRG